MELITSLSDYEVCVNHTKRNFDEIKQTIQKQSNERLNKLGLIGITINIINIGIDSRIGCNTLWEWAKRMDKIDKKEKLDDFFAKFENEFYKAFYETIFCEKSL